MKTPIILVLLASIFVTNGSALNCYHCSSLVSWEDCFKMLRNETCAENIKSCMVTEIVIKSHNSTSYSYARGCAQQCNIESNPHCKHPHITCTLHCCEGNLCNKVKRVSPATVVPTVDAISGALNTQRSCYVVVYLVVMYLISEQSFDL